MPFEPLTSVDTAPIPEPKESKAGFDRRLGEWIDRTFWKNALKGMPGKEEIYEYLQEKEARGEKVTAEEYIRAARGYFDEETGSWKEPIEGLLPAAIAAIPGYMGGRALGTAVGRVAVQGGSRLAAAGAGAALGGAAGIETGPGAIATSILGGVAGAMVSRQLANFMDPKQAGSPFFTTEVLFPGLIGSAGKRILPPVLGRVSKRAAEFTKGLPGLAETTGYKDVKALRGVLKRSAAPAEKMAEAQAAEQVVADAVQEATSQGQPMRGRPWASNPLNPRLQELAAKGGPQADIEYGPMKLLGTPEQRMLSREAETGLPHPGLEQDRAVMRGLAPRPEVPPSTTDPNAGMFLSPERTERLLQPRETPYTGPYRPDLNEAVFPRVHMRELPALRDVQGREISRSVIRDALESEVPPTTDVSRQLSPRQMEIDFSAAAPQTSAEAHALDNLREMTFESEQAKLNRIIEHVVQKGSVRKSRSSVPAFLSREARSKSLSPWEGLKQTEGPLSQNELQIAAGEVFREEMSPYHKDIWLRLTTARQHLGQDLPVPENLFSRQDRRFVRRFLPKRERNLRDYKDTTLHPAEVDAVSKTTLWSMLPGSVRDAVRDPKKEWPTWYDISREKLNRVLRQFLDEEGLSPSGITKTRLTRAKFRTEEAGRRYVSQRAKNLGQLGTALEDRKRDIVIHHAKGGSFQGLWAKLAQRGDITMEELSRLMSKSYEKMLTPYQKALVRDVIKEGEDALPFLYKSEVEYFLGVLSRRAR